MKRWMRLRKDLDEATFSPVNIFGLLVLYNFGTGDAVDSAWDGVLIVVGIVLFLRKTRET